MKTNKDSSQPKRKPRTHIFRFDEIEEVRMIKAIKGSVAFMQSYGKGNKSLMIDRRHYL